MSLKLKRDYFNELAGEWDQLPSPPDTPERLARFARLCVPPGVGSVLDVGCGTGLLVDYLRRNAGPGSRIVELDLAEQMLVRSRVKAGHPGILYVCADARNPPFPAGSFDLVICFNALPHMDPIEGALRGLLACLRPGGRLAVGHLMGSESLNALHASIGGVVAADRLPPAAHLARLLEELGAEILRQEDTEGSYLVEGRKPA